MWPDFRPITDTREWRHFKLINEVYSTVEEGMFNLQTKSGKPEIFLRPKEKVNVPFKLLTFKADHSVKPNVSDDAPRWTSNYTPRMYMYSHVYDYEKTQKISCI